MRAACPASAAWPAQERAAGIPWARALPPWPVPPPCSQPSQPLPLAAGAPPGELPWEPPPCLPAWRSAPARQCEQGERSGRWMAGGRGTASNQQGTSGTQEPAEPARCPRRACTLRRIIPWLAQAAAWPRVPPVPARCRGQQSTGLPTGPPRSDLPQPWLLPARNAAAGAPAAGSTSAAAQGSTGSCLPRLLANTKQAREEQVAGQGRVLLQWQAGWQSACAALCQAGRRSGEQGSRRTQGMPPSCSRSGILRATGLSERRCMSGSSCTQARARKGPATQALSRGGSAGGSRNLHRPAVHRCPAPRGTHRQRRRPRHHQLLRRRLLLLLHRRRRGGGGGLHGRHRRHAHGPARPAALGGGGRRGGGSGGHLSALADEEFQLGGGAHLNLILGHNTLSQVLLQAQLQAEGAGAGKRQVVRRGGGTGRAGNTAGGSRSGSCSQPFQLCSRQQGRAGNKTTAPAASRSRQQPQQKQQQPRAAGSGSRRHRRQPPPAQTQPPVAPRAPAPPPWARAAPGCGPRCAPPWPAARGCACG